MTEIIPAIDLIDGKCVRLTHGDYTQKKIYSENPLEVAKAFEGVGIKRLHLVDLDGAKAGTIVNNKILEKIANGTSLIIDFGGGIKTDESIKNVFDSGATIATIGSVAVKQPQLFWGWIKKYGSEKILLGADVKDEKIAVSGWLEKTDINIFDFISDNVANGVTQLFCTDISKDGALQGPSIELYKKIIAKFPQLNFIASGGVTTIDDITALENIGCRGVIIGKAIYEERISAEELKKILTQN
jgi:phosphoribosylformimino-5-aminoimidazole carboxamide ribotide isomerase